MNVNRLRWVVRGSGLIAVSSLISGFVLLLIDYPNSKIFLSSLGALGVGLVCTGMSTGMITLWASTHPRTRHQLAESVPVSALSENPLPAPAPIIIVPLLPKATSLYRYEPVSDNPSPSSKSQGLIPF